MSNTCHIGLKTFIPEVLGNTSSVDGTTSLEIDPLVDYDQHCLDGQHLQSIHIHSVIEGVLSSHRRVPGQTSHEECG